MRRYVPIYNPQNGVHFGGRISGPRIRDPGSGVGPISGDFGPQIGPDLGPLQIGTPKYTQNGSILGVFRGVIIYGIIKGPYPVHPWYVQDWPRLGVQKGVILDPTGTGGIQGPKMAPILGPTDDTSDSTDPTFQMTHHI